ncbi:3-carboxy-cis,cis-muconate cycloisomerase [Lichenifustis flavocetrariae]|uniref:3-carboxy-cis,cis-muconate cycloisomerase n=1 Tax=Lichenifustis flavocetrariae TaxID=2949735 RepID=A0AA41YTJ6_9HYPH|nr:3-carboxy-cis,cis-muconate cycloisomerase [Lichenifustis flavocetrariae]MCW6508324.1 3-carboxy-cis,cis-muconate cycloisomerase [Lichenifustis flavocetrariae]
MTPGRSLLGALVGDAELEALFSDEADLQAQIRIEAALAMAEAECGLIAPEAATAIGEACARFVPDLAVLAGSMAQDGVMVPGLVRQLRAAVGDIHGAALHMGATSQDLIDTSLVLRLGRAITILEARLDALGAGLVALKARDGSRRLMAHTRMQVALPFSAADKIATWQAPLVRHKTRLAELKPRLLLLQLGGPVGTRVELGERADAIAANLAARLGLGHAPPWHSQRDGIAEFGSWLSLVSGALGKLGQDVALLAQNEVAALKVAGGGTSSAMAHKQNPVAAEVLVAMARFNAGALGTLHQALVHENERSGAAWTLEWIVLPQMVVTTGAALTTAQTLVDALSFT